MMSGALLDSDFEQNDLEDESTFWTNKPLLFGYVKTKGKYTYVDYDLRTKCIHWFKLIIINVDIDFGQ